MGILEEFFKDPKNEEEFQRWLLSVEAEEGIGASSLEPKPIWC
jgi:hypothetical protein